MEGSGTLTERRAVDAPAVSARRTALVILALLFALTIVLSALVPLLPRFVDEFGISTVQAGALFSVVTLVMVVGSVPAGMLADRVGPRAVVVAAIGFLLASCLLQGLASGYWMLFAGRALFGIAHTAIWGAALAWLSHLELTPRLRAMALGGTMTVAGAGHSFGPIFVGTTAERFGLLVPFAAAGALAALVALLLAREREPPRTPAEERPAFGETWRSVRSNAYVSAALLLLVTSGGMMVGFSLLIPLRLDANGLSEAEIGAVFSVFGVLGVCVSVLVNRLGARVARPLVGVVCITWLALACLVPATSRSTEATLLFMAISGPAGTTVITIAYPMAGEGAHRAGLARGAVMGLLNAAWATSATLAPLGGGAIAQTVGERAAWLAVAALLAAGGVLVLRLVRGAPA